MNTYEISLKFSTDTPLTEKQKDHLLDVFSLQLEEPQDQDGEDESYIANIIYSTITER